MSLSRVYVCPLCGDDLEKPDDENEELVCPSCSVSFPLPTTRALEYAPSGGAIASPGMVHQVGTDLNQSILELRKAGVIQILKRLPDGQGDEWFWVNLTQKLKDRRVPPERISLICMRLRKYVARVDKERDTKLHDMLSRILGEKSCSQRSKSRE